MTRPLIVFAPGAGAPSSSKWMQVWAQRLETLGDVVPFDYPYQVQRARRPDPHQVLVAAHRAAIAEARRTHSGPLVLAGKSMGSRMGCHVSLEEKVEALVCFGYPLQAAGSGKLRDQVLLDLRTPVLFLQGTRDKLCPLDLLGSVRSRMQARSELFVVEGGDHSLQVLKSQSQSAADEAVFSQVSGFLNDVLNGSPRTP